MDVKEGDVLAGKYRVERVLGQGGMGVVVAAMHLQLEQRVALKFLLPEALQHPEQLTRFSREARAAARMRNDHVARVIDVGTLDTGVPYIVMEYLDGSDLSHYLEKQGPLAIAQAAALTLEACEGLAEAHALGIVHRDLKPANLFLARTRDGTTCLKIVDFGISKILAPGTGEFDMTRTGTVMGSPYYMSPEQMRSSRAVDARADIWSLGVILYELVSGRVPFDAPTLPQLCGMILTEPTPLLADARRDTPPRFAAVVSRCLEERAEEPAVSERGGARRSARGVRARGRCAVGRARLADFGRCRPLERAGCRRGCTPRPADSHGLGPHVDEGESLSRYRGSARRSGGRGRRGLLALRARGKRSAERRLGSFEPGECGRERDHGSERRTTQAGRGAGLPRARPERERERRCTHRFRGASFRSRGLRRGSPEGHPFGFGSPGTRTGARSGCAQTCPLRARCRTLRAGGDCAQGAKPARRSTLKPKNFPSSRLPVNSLFDANRDGVAPSPVVGDGRQHVLARR